MKADETVPTPRAAGRAPLISRLRFLHAEQRQGGHVELAPGGTLTIGRAGSATGPLALMDSQVSRNHARVDIDEHGAARLEDLSSRNGTFVNGARCLGAQTLVTGDIVRVGSTLLMFETLRFATDQPLLFERPPLRGPSFAMDQVRGRVGQVAKSELPVLIIGPTGVGKELVAQEIHRRSQREGTLMAINCGALPEALAESELFGHVAGAFTGAQGKKPGIFMAADGGTLFLDEIGELPPPLQPKLLRALADGEIRPVGDTRTRKVNVRVVAATHRDLSRDVAEGRFRQDLFSRLAGWSVHVPALRERPDDVLPLFKHFTGKNPRTLSLTVDCAEALLLYAWPGNVRELKHVAMSTAMQAGSSATIRLEHLPATISEALSDRASADDSDPSSVALAGIPRDVAPSEEHLKAVLAHYEGNIANVAAFFGKNRRQIYRWTERHGISVESFRAPLDPKTGSK